MTEIPSPAPSPTSGFPLMNTHQQNSIMMPADHPKILQNLLYGHGYLASGYPSIANAYYHHHHNHHHAHQQHLLDPNDPFRPRSGSLQSLGSTASSNRPERSPSRESNSSHESLVLRASPISIAEESPSPSPPSANESKLLSILKGNVTSPFSGMFNGSSKPSTHHHQLPPPQQQPQYYHAQKSPNHVDIQRKQTLLNEPLSFSARHEPYSLSKRQMSTSVSSISDAPIDLSFKPKKSRLDSVTPRRFTMPAELSSKAALARARIAARGVSSSVNPPEATIVRPPTQQQDFLEPISPPPRACSRDSLHSNEDSAGGSSILRSILSGNNGASLGFSRSVLSRERQVMSAPASPATHSFSEPASPLGGIFNRLGGTTSPCDQNPRVTIAKKTLFPVRARVTDWIQKTVQFAKSLSEFSSLSESDQLTLIMNALARVILLYMAENHFEFAVTPVLVDSEANQGRDNGSQEIPTMKSVESIQSFIKKCQNLNLDHTEYECVKTALIFHTGVAGISDRKLIEELSTHARQELQQHERKSHPCEVMRYSSILLLLHTLSGINSIMVQNLFCKHTFNQGTMEDYIKDLLLKNEHKQ